MQSDTSAFLAPNRRTSLLPLSRPFTAGNSYVHDGPASNTLPSLRRNRLSYQPAPTYQNEEWNILKHYVDSTHPVIQDEPISQIPFGHFETGKGSQIVRGHTRRPSTLADSIRNGISSVRSLGRRMSLSIKPKSKVTFEAGPDIEEIKHSLGKDSPLEVPEVPFFQTRPKSMIAQLRARRRPSMPILNFTPAPEIDYQPPKRPAYHRAVTLTNNHRPDYPVGGAGARASAAAQNEALQLARATPLPPYRPRSSQSSEEYRDNESGIGITIDGINRSDSRTQHIVRRDPADVLATELLEHMLAFLDASTLLDLDRVSRRWRELSHSQTVWRQVFYRQYAPSASSRILGAPRTAGLGKNTAGQDFRKLYYVRKMIDKRWANGEAAAIYLNGHKDSVYCVQFDEDKIVTGSRDNTIRIWDARTYQCIKKLAPPNNSRERENISRADIAPRGVTPFFKIDASSPDTRSRPLPIWHQASILCLQYDEEILVTGSSDFTCIVWSVQNDYQPLFKLAGHRAGVLDVCIDKRRIVTCSKDTTIKIWDRKTGVLIKTLSGHRGPVNAVQVRGNLLASASGDGMAKLWRLDTGMCIKEFHSKERGLACVEFSEDGRTIFAGGNDHVIYEYDTTTGTVKRELQGHQELVRSLHLDSMNGRIISGSYDHSIKVWDSKHGTGENDGGLKLSLEGWTSSWMLAAKSNYRKIACASQDGRVVIVDFGFGIHGADLVEA